MRLARAPFAVIEQAHEVRHAECAGEQHRLVVARRGRLPDGIDVAHGLVKLRFRHAHLAEEIVQVTDECAEDLPGARIGRALHFFEHRRCDVLLSFNDHRLPFAATVAEDNAGWNATPLISIRMWGCGS